MILGMATALADTTEREPLDLEAAITALLDREETVASDERARIRRVRHDLERELGDALAVGS